MGRDSRLKERGDDLEGDGYFHGESGLQTRQEEREHHLVEDVQAEIEASEDYIERLETKIAMLTMKIIRRKTLRTIVNALRGRDDPNYARIEHYEGCLEKERRILEERKSKLKSVKFEASFGLQWGKQKKLFYKGKDPMLS